ncbi:MAG: hypothetical protein P8N43_07170 [Alphaproteobacteria bacterium]|jgi:hypothetical protein|nr:hypothetical protein [Alphaproteobacteria bacterium]
MQDPSSRIADILKAIARDGGTITYREIADRAQIPSPGRIQTVTGALEEMIRADHAAGRPLLAAVAISRSGDGLPGAGFFELCREIELYFGPSHGPQAELFHTLQLRRLALANLVESEKP